VTQAIDATADPRRRDGRAREAQGARTARTAHESHRVRRIAVVALAVAASAAVPTSPVSALPTRTGQQEPTAQEEQAEVRERQGEVALEIDVIEAHATDLTAALDMLEANVEAREADLADANAAADAAAAELAAAETAVQEAEAQLLVRQGAANTLAVESYMEPPSLTAFDALYAETFSDAVLIQSLLDMQADAEAEVIDDLRAAEANLSEQRDARATAKATADEKQLAAEAEVAEVTAARDQQSRFVAAAQEALDQRLAEAANLQARDDELSRQIEQEQRVLALQLAQMAQQLPPPSAPQTSGDVTTANVNCRTGETITVAASIADNVQALLNASDADGVVLCGWGYRSTEAQIQLRREHCGTSDYAIWDMPSSQCSPPTARPGTSQHELGLAIDFTCNGGGSIGDHSSPCFQWLDAHAGDYGLINYPVEPWHWSTTGR
jgi:LAS superfamily LD-carboxypeptidase LdcB